MSASFGFLIVVSYSHQTHTLDIAHNLDYCSMRRPSLGSPVYARHADALSMHCARCVRETRRILGTHRSIACPVYNMSCLSLCTLRLPRTFRLRCGLLSYLANIFTAAWGFLVLLLSPVSLINHNCTFFVCVDARLSVTLDGPCNKHYSEFTILMTIVF